MSKEGASVYIHVFSPRPSSEERRRTKDERIEGLDDRRRETHKVELYVFLRKPPKTPEKGQTA
jgi:hypothetical protein